MHKNRILLLFLLTVFPLMVFSHSHFKGKRRIESHDERSMEIQKGKTARGSAINWDVLDSGGGLMFSHSNVIGGSLGQIAPGVCSTASTVVSAGYWAGIDSLPPPPCTCIVKPDGTGEFSTIQDAIDTCICDVILLTGGTFTEEGNRDIDFRGKRIEVASQSGDPDDCIIDCQGDSSNPHRGFHFHSGEDSNSVLRGISIINGWHGDGGGILCGDSCSPMINYCKISSNSAEGTGGGICCKNHSSPRIKNCTIAGNSAASGGGIQTGYSASPTITGCLISGNAADSLGGGLFCYDHSTPTCTSTTITGNSAGAQGGGIYTSYASSPGLSKTILWGNCADDAGGEVWLAHSSSSISITCCDVDSSHIEGPGGPNYGANNIFVNPRFCDSVPCASAPTDSGDYHLFNISPCAPDSQPICGLIGALGVDCQVPSCEYLGRCLDSMYLDLQGHTIGVQDGEGGVFWGELTQDCVWFMMPMLWIHQPWVEYYGLIVGYDPETCSTVCTFRIQDSFWDPSGLAFDDRDTSFWHTSLTEDSLFHIDSSGYRIASYPAYDSITGLAFDADNNHLWGIISGEPDIFVEYDISTGVPLLIQGPMPVPWDSNGAGGLDYDERKNLLVAVNRNTKSLWCFFDVGPDYSGPPGPSEPGVSIYRSCDVVHTPNPLGAAALVIDTLAIAFVASNDSASGFPLDTYKYRYVGTPGHFIRGDCTGPTKGYGDGYLGMSDAIYILKVLYVPNTPPPHCWDALDVNDDGKVTMADAIYLLKWLYVPSSPPPPPPCCVFPDSCGPDPTPDDLDCQDHPCQHVLKVSSDERQVDGKMLFGYATIRDQKVIVPVYLQNNRSLSGFAYTISYDTEVLSFISADNGNLVTGNFDFFSARPKEELGSVSVGGVIDMGLKSNLAPGYNQVATLIFELKTNKFQETILKFTDVELVDTEARSTSAHTNTCAIRIPFSIPKVFGLGQNYPNPVKDWTAIRYQLPKSTHTTLRIYNSAGQVVKTLVDEAKNPGYYSEVWKGKDNLGRKVSSGVYFYQLKTDEYTEARKLVVVQ